MKFYKVFEQNIFTYFQIYSSKISPNYFRNANFLNIEEVLSNFFHKIL